VQIEEYAGHAGLAGLHEDRILAAAANTIISSVFFILFAFII